MSSPTPDQTPISAVLRTGDRQLDATLRPSVWDDYVGQSHVKNNVQVLLSAAKKRGDMPEHVLFYGPPGVGKTTLAHLVAAALEAPLKSTSRTSSPAQFFSSMKFTNSRTKLKSCSTLP
jgi:Holliday junction DNA helicase RuvB